MSSSPLRWIAPIPAPTAEGLVAFELTREFYREVDNREEFERYCEWYRSTAKKHQQELEKMRRDINLMGWFCGRWWR
jgi:hypothetical protein